MFPWSCFIQYPIDPSTHRFAVRCRPMRSNLTCALAQSPRARSFIAADMWKAAARPWRVPIGGFRRAFRSMEAWLASNSGWIGRGRTASRRLVGYENGIRRYSPPQARQHHLVKIAHVTYACRRGGQAADRSIRTDLAVAEPTNRPTRSITRKSTQPKPHSNHTLPLRVFPARLRDDDDAGG